MSGSSVHSEISLDIFPREIAYSQSIIGPTMFVGDGKPRASVECWTTDTPYSIPIDIVLNRGEYVTFDNQRLYSARNYAPSQTRIVAIVHAFEDSVPDIALDLGVCAVTFFWNGAADLISGCAGVHILSIAVNYWGLMTSLRCASQGSTFGLSGSHMEPTIDEQPLVEPHYIISKIPMTQQHAVELPKLEGIADLRAAVDSGNLVTFATGAPRILGRIMHRSDFNKLVLEHIEGLEVLSYSMRTNQQLILKGSLEKDNEYWLDQERHQQECQRMMEMETRWMESDIEKVIYHLDVV